MTRSSSEQKLSPTYITTPVSHTLWISWRIYRLNLLKSTNCYSSARTSYLYIQFQQTFFTVLQHREKGCVKNVNSEHRITFPLETACTYWSVFWTVIQKCEIKYYSYISIIEEIVAQRRRLANVIGGTLQRIFGCSYMILNRMQYNNKTNNEKIFPSSIVCIVLLRTVIHIESILIQWESLNLL